MWNGVLKPVPAFGVFDGTGGVVTIDLSAGAVSATGLQFAVDGYSLTGDALTLAGAGGESIIRVGNGSAAGADFTAAIASTLTGSTKLVKTDLGTLVLTGANSYTGGTEVRGGTLVGSADSIRAIWSTTARWCSIRRARGRSRGRCRAPARRSSRARARWC